MADEDDAPELGISTDTVCWVIARARAFDAKEAGDGDSDPDDDDPESHLLEEEGDTIADELREAIVEMNEDEQAALIALAWIGRGEFDVSEWDEAVRTAKERNLRNADDYLVGMPLLADYLEEGLSAFGLSCD
jgi:hypothetical protein